MKPIQIAISAGSVLIDFDLKDLYGCVYVADDLQVLMYDVQFQEIAEVCLIF